MPVPLRTPYSKAEAKYNVITDFPKLGLHEAAASGNLGLVQYALNHGQPINSVLDGVLPLHAACAGGHIPVVKLLIDHGADVNAPRLPRRYFNDKNRDASAPIVGTSGSTPLHFAAANGNTEVVTLLLYHGAHADRADKHNVTPEKLARDNNWMECAQVLREWVLNKDRDLREREELLGDGAGAASSANVSHEHSMEPESPSFRRRLLVKRSDTALNILKASASQSDRRLNPTLTSASPPSSPLKTFGQYSFNPDANGSASLSQGRRPSLPQIHPPPPPETARRKPQTPSPIQRRPRSAGNGADRSPDQEVYLPFGRGGSGRKLTNKISLLFKKGIQGEPSESQTTTHSAPTPASASATALPLSSTPSSKGRPHASSVDTSPDDHTPSKQRNHAPSDSSQRGCKILPLKQLQPPSASFLDFDNSAPPSPARLPLQSAVDLHNALAQHGRDRSRSNATNISAISITDTSDEFSSPNYGSFTRPSVLRSHDNVLRSRSGSNASGVVDVETFLPNDSSDQVSSLGLTEDGGRTARPSILRGHQRTGSSGQSSSSTPSRALRFDSVSNGERNRRAPSLTGSPASIHARLQPTPSSSSLRNRIEVISSQSASRDRSPSINSARPQPPPPPPVFDEEDEEQDYGQQLPTSRLAPVIDEDGEELHPPSASLLRQRGMSFGSSSQTSLPPIFSGEHANSDTIPPYSADIIPFSSTPMDNADFPPDNQLSVPDSDRRGRGDSLSSTSTADSGNIPQYSTSGSTVGSGTSVAVLTPLIDANLSLPSTAQVLEEEDRDEETIQDHEVKRQKDGFPLPPPIMVQTPSTYSNLNDRRAHSPLDIDISLISSHAQAEALVERTRQDILELTSGQELSPGNGMSTATSGPTPLSAKLAALGESLALERKLREQAKTGVANQDGAGLPSPLSPLDSQFDALTPVEGGNRNGVERQHSLEAKHRPGVKPRSAQSKRPSTADGLGSRSANNSFFTDQSRPTHHASLSASPPITSQTSTSFDRREFYTAPHQRSAVSGNGNISNSSSKLYEPLTAPPLVASRSKKDLDAHSLSRVSSTEGVDTETESTGSPLAPTAGSTTPRKRDPVRNANSAMKLKRMGFQATDQTVARATQPPPGKRFQGLKSIMATLKGKS